MLGKHLVSPRGLNAELTNKYVGVEGIVTRVSIVKPKLVYSNKFWSVKEYQMSLTSPLNKNINGNFEANGNISNTVPIKDANQNPLYFEYDIVNWKIIK